ncbi:MAG: hypothetical protein ACXWQ5_00030 [Ktedonobacterales bacterium]
MNLFSQANAHMALTPAQRAALRFLKSLLLVFIVSAAPIVLAQLSTGTISEIDWYHTLDIAVSTGSFAVLSTLWKYASAIQDVAKGNTVTKLPTLSTVGTVHIQTAQPDAAKPGDVWIRPEPTPAQTSGSLSVDTGGVGTLPITEFLKIAGDISNQTSPNVLADSSVAGSSGTVANVPVSSEAGAPTVDSDAPASQSGL